MGRAVFHFVLSKILRATYIANENEIALAPWVPSLCLITARIDFGECCFKAPDQ